VDQHAISERRLLNHYVSTYVRASPSGTMGLVWDEKGGVGRWSIKDHDDKVRRPAEPARGETNERYNRD